jgi:hypothetical protein
MRMFKLDLAAAWIFVVFVLLMWLPILISEGPMTTSTDRRWEARLVRASCLEAGTESVSARATVVDRLSCRPGVEDVTGSLCAARARAI